MTPFVSICLGHLIILSILTFICYLLCKYNKRHKDRRRCAERRKSCALNTEKERRITKDRRVFKDRRVMVERV